jgi:hypothetical protein
MTLPVVAAGCLSLLQLGGAGRPSAHLTTAPEASARIVPILAEAWSGSSVNVVADQHHTLFSDGRVQYAAFYAADRRLVLARRNLSEDGWETVITPYTGNVADAHNTASIVVDGDGYLHLAWDHHASPLNYARGIAPGSLELGPKASMTGRREDSVTYPSFFRLPGGDLLFLYRDGRSGRGNVVLNRYDTKAPRWRQVHANLVDGEGARSAYVAATLDVRGTLHLAWNWRDTPDVATNHDLCYARSADGGATWTTSNGAPLALPVTAATAEYAARIPQGRDLMNPPSITADADGRPYVTTYWSPPGTHVPQFHVVRHDGARWQVIPAGRRTTPFSLQGTGTRRPPISRAVVLTRRRGGKAQEVYLVHRDDGGRITALSCDDIQSPRWTARELTAGGLGAWEPSVDPVSWQTSGEIHLLVQAVSQRDGDDRRPVVAPPTPIGLLAWKP